MATKKKAKKTTSKKANAKRLALESVAEVVDCRTCVVEVIQNHCDATVGDFSDKLSDLCFPCDTGVMADLEDLLKAKCGAPSNLKLKCSMSVGRVASLVCGD